MTATIILDHLPSSPSPSPSLTACIKYYNVINPSSDGSWSSLIPSITTHFIATAHNNNAATPVPWFSALKASASQTEDVATNRAIELLAFSRKMATGSNSGQVEVELETAQPVQKHFLLKRTKGHRAEIEMDTYTARSARFLKEVIKERRSADDKRVTPRKQKIFHLFTANRNPYMIQ